jgi:lipase
VTIHTATRTYGHGPRKAVAIHCSLAHSGAWRGLSTHLKDALTITALDLPMHGRSGDWDGQGDLHDVATDMTRALIAEPVDLIGHSFGATVALRLAVEQPEMVRSLTLIEPVLFSIAIQDDGPEAQAYLEGSRAFGAQLAEGEREEATRGFNRQWGDGTKWAEIPEQTRRYMVDRIGFIPASGDFIERDRQGICAPGMIERAAMPTLLVEGDTSPPIMATVGDLLQKRLPNVRRLVVEGAGHMVPITHPEPVAGAILTLLEPSTV